MAKRIYKNLEGEIFYNEKFDCLMERFDPSQIIILWEGLDAGLPIQAIAYSDIPAETMDVFIQHMKKECKWKIKRSKTHRKERKLVNLFMDRFNYESNFVPPFNFRREVFYWKVGRAFKDPVLVDTILHYGQDFFKDANIPQNCSDKDAFLLAYKLFNSEKVINKAKKKPKEQFLIENKAVFENYLKEQGII